MTSKLELRRLTGRIGAEITGLSLRGDLPEDTIDQIKAAIYEHKVVVCREQHHFGPAEMTAFAGRLGELVPATYPGEKFQYLSSAAESPAVLVITPTPVPFADYWHTDSTFVLRPPAIGILRGVEIPPIGGDTLWANTETAYQDLPSPLRDLVDGLRAVHGGPPRYGSKFAPNELPRRAPPSTDMVMYETVHPVVRVHPITGARVLMLGTHAKHIIGFTNYMISTDLFRTLQEYIVRPENTMRWSWRVGDVVIWDNRATQHYAVYDYGDAMRKLYRISTLDSVPVGIDGRPSELGPQSTETPP